MNQNKRQPRRIETAVGIADALGNIDLLERNKLGLICSRSCPGDVIVKTYDCAGLMRRSGLAMISGFHSPIEKDFLSILLRGSDPIIIVQAHRLSTTRLPLKWQEAVDRGRLLLLSPFGNNDKRVTTELATERNRYVAITSDEVLIPYAAPGSKTEALAFDLLASCKRVYTLNNRPSPLLLAGAEVVMPDFFASRARTQAPVGGEQ